MAAPSNVLGIALLIVHLTTSTATPSEHHKSQLDGNDHPLTSPDDAPGSIGTPPNAPETSWVPSGGFLDVPRGLSSIFQLNGTFFIVGGCLDTNCAGRSGAVSRYDPIADSVVPSAVSEVPMQFTIPSKTPVLPPQFIQATFAGPTAVVPVANGELRAGVLNVETRPWLVGPCAVYTINQGNSSEPTVSELYHGIWGFSLDFSSKELYGRLPANIPVRGNASCQAYGSRIFIVGGILVDTLRIVDTIDAFDTTTLAYYPNVQRHVEHVMNSAVAIDNHMLYIVGGQTSEGCTSSSASYMWTATGAAEVPSVDAPRRQVDFCQSSRVTAYYFPPIYFVNESTPLLQYILPEVPVAVIRRNVNNSERGVGEEVIVEVVELLKAYSFGGTLTVSSFSTVASTLTVEHLGPSWAQQPQAGPGDRLLAPTWQVQQVAGLGIRHASMMMYIVPYVIFGCGLAIFSFGGSTTSDAMTGEIYQRFVGLSMPAIRGTPPVVEILGQNVNISLQPPMQGFLRLSDNAACVGNTVGTSDEPVNANQQQVAVSFLPLFPADEVYACFSFGPVDIDTNLTELMFFSVINAFHPFAVLQHGQFLPTPSPPTLPTRTKIILGVVVPAGSILLMVLLVLFVRRKLARYAELGTDVQKPLIQEDAKDIIIRQTTSDSRYTVVKRIGEGAFSSVYLVSPKADPSLTYALKFMVCADDRERLEAIKECETINSVQAHPNIIQLIDMFMNYEFGGHRNASRLDENDQAMLLTSSMHAIQIQHRQNKPTALQQSPQQHHGGTPPLLPDERTPLTAATKGSHLSPSNVQMKRTPPTGLNTTSPSSVIVASMDDASAASNVHTRYLCLVMQYHPSGDLCRYVLRRAEELQQQRAVCNASISNDSLLEWVATRKKSSTTSDEGGGPSSHKSSCSSRADVHRHALTERQLLSVAYQIASVLQYLHAQRPPIVHRDLKPENILIKGPSPDPSDPFVPVVVTDFGLAFIQEEHRKSGRGGGTRPYISPESWKGQTTTASDVWSLGCVLYALATQRLTAQTVRVMFQDAKYPNFTQTILTDLIRGQKYSCEFGVFVASILEADPKKRPTAEKLVRMFDVRAMPGPSEREIDEDCGGYIAFKKDAFGPGGAIALVPPECLENGLVPSTDSVAD